MLSILAPFPCIRIFHAVQVGGPLGLVYVRSFFPLLSGTPLDPMPVCPFGCSLRGSAFRIPTKTNIAHKMHAQQYMPRMFASLA